MSLSAFPPGFYAELGICNISLQSLPYLRSPPSISLSASPPGFYAELGICNISLQICFLNLRSPASISLSVLPPNFYALY